MKDAGDRVHGMAMHSFSNRHGDFDDLVIEQAQKNDRLHVEIHKGPFHNDFAGSNSQSLKT